MSCSSMVIFLISLTTNSLCFDILVDVTSRSHKMFGFFPKNLCSSLSVLNFFPLVLTTTVVESQQLMEAGMSNIQQLGHGIYRFFVIFLGSAAIGSITGLISSLVLKHIDLYFNPSLEFGLLLCFVYLPYALAEGIHLSGIMSILFCGIVMSQYTHYNLSPVTQITMQQTMRTLSFVCESMVFAYLGIGIFR